LNEERRKKKRTRHDGQDILTHERAWVVLPVKEKKREKNANG